MPPAPRSRILAAVLALLLVPAYGFVSVSATDAPAEASDNIRHVKHLPYELRYGNAASDGTDLEFVTLKVRANEVATRGWTPIADADREAPGVQRTFAIAGSYDNGMQIIDVTEPERADIVAVYDCGISQGDIQVFQRDDLDGRTFATFTMDNGYTPKLESDCYQDAGPAAQEARFGTFIVEITDPYRPRTVSFVPVSKGSHNQTVHPSGKWLYNSNSELITNVLEAGIEVFSIEDITAPRHVTTLALPKRPGLGTDSHDLTFNTEGDRAYSAALSQTVIIDTTDPTAPEVVTSFMDPAINVEHQADPVTLTDATTGLEREFLVVEDEFAGASGGEQTCPSGGVHIYDITGELERNPVKVGYWNIDDLTTTRAAGRGRCTAHVFELHQEEALMTIAFYNLGVSVVDLSGLVGVALGSNGIGMKEVAFAHFEDSDTWAVKAPYVDRDGSFYIYGNDQDRGMDIYEVDLTLTADAAGLLQQGTGRDVWLGPNAALQRAQLGADVGSDYRPLCLLGDR